MRAHSQCLSELRHTCSAAGKVQRLEKEKQNFVEEITDLSAQACLQQFSLLCFFAVTEHCAAEKLVH